MHNGLKTEIYRIFLISFSALVFGVMTGFVWPSLLLAGLLYSIWLLYQTSRFYHWLASDFEDLPPDSNGLWGDIFEALYKSHKERQESQRHLQQQLEQVRGFTAALREGVVLINPKGVITWWNQSAETLFAFREDTDLHQPLVNLIRTPAFIEFFRKGQFEEPIDIPSPNNPAITLQIQLSYYGNRELLMVAQDVTRLRQLEKMRKDFVANVSHELRTPLTVVRGYVEAMAEDSESFAEVWQKPLKQMQKQTIRMSDIVSDLSTLSRLETSNTTTEEDEINLNQLLNNIRQDALLIDPEKNLNITIEGDTDTCLIGSHNEIQSALSNLVFNAVKYAKDEGGDIHIAWQDEGGKLKLCVSDNGIGMDPKHIPRLTERFYRVDTSHSRKTGGTGLGLAIVKHVLQRHQASLKVESQPGKGSQFCCLFPSSRVLRGN